MPEQEIGDWRRVAASGIVRAMVPIEIQGVTKVFGATVAVRQVTLSVPAGALFFLLGPSGCGKTTLLRMIAGFAVPTEGRILFGQQDMSFVPPHLRNTGMVFQSYALWPHMTVAQNVAFGLDVRKVGGPERSRRVGEALELVQMAAYAGRKPAELSGGQQQRVALARALAIRPQCLLLDEPLSNLDAKLRGEMRIEIRRIVKQTGTTAIYVTHDQKEALSMADGIAVLQGGLLVQTGTPEQLYHHPVSKFVADFIGEANFIAGTVAANDGAVIRLDTKVGALEAAGNGREWKVGDKVLAAIRPEALKVNGGGDRNVMKGRRVATTYLGEIAEHVIELSDGQTVRAFELNPRIKNDDGQECVLTVRTEDVMLVANN
jgi:iron(III) transport system ATP-binding protein